jgi:uncharacterized membrane protein
MSFGMVVFWGFVAWLLYTVVTRDFVRAPQGPAASDQPRAERDRSHAILEERLARGEIDADTYRYLTDVIEGKHRTPTG